MFPLNASNATKNKEMVIPRPEVYQKHTFVIKLNRKGKAQVCTRQSRFLVFPTPYVNFVLQDRMLVLSTMWLYNVEVQHNPTRLDTKSLKVC